MLTYYSVSDAPPEHSLLPLLTLREVRAYVRRSHGISLAVFIGVAYALGSMLLGGMLVLAHYDGGYSVILLWGNALGLQNWNYPGLLIEAPWGFVELPFFATLSMVLVSAGVGIGMAVALLLGAQLIRERRTSARRPTATGTIAGLTPAMIALVTLGACCSTTAAATAGIGLVAQSSGSTTSNLVLNNWYLGVFQMVVVYVALIAQELLLRVYGNLFGARDPAFQVSASAPRPLDRRTVVVGAARAALLAGGVTWMLSVLATWTTVNPATASAALWFNWVFEHGLIGGLAVLVALAPKSAYRWIVSSAGSVPGVSFRALLLISAWTLGGWVPPPLAGMGVEGFGNELLGLFGLSGSLGAVAPAYPWGLALALRWGFQYLLLAACAGSIAAWPRDALAWLSESHGSPVPVAGEVGPSAASVTVPLEVR